MERYDWAVRIAELQARFLPRIRVALVGNEPLIHPERFGEIVARNRGADARAFTDEAEALRWLGVAQDFALRQAEGIDPAGGGMR